ncbi:MAG: NDP-sugar synthase [bacterium]
MKALVLCAGFGTRLRPLTDSIAKPLVKVMNIPLLEYTLDLLDQNGIDDVYINRHYFPEQFKEIKTPKNMKITFSLEEDILGTLGGVLSFEEQLADDDFLVINGDILFNLDFNELVTKHKRKKSLVTMVVKEREGKETPVFVDDFSNVVSIGGTGSSIYKEYMFAGIQMLNPEIFNIVKKKAPPSCIVKDLYIPYINSGGHINSVTMKKDDLWIETGDMAKYLGCNIKMLEMLSEYKLKINYEEFISQYWKGHKQGSRIIEAVENIWLGDDCTIDYEATISAPVFIGNGVKIEKGSVIGPNVIIGNNVKVCQNARIKDSLILDGVQVNKDTSVYRSIVSKDFLFESK